MVKKVKKDANKRRQRNLKSESCIMGITALCLLLAACGTSSGRAEENPDVWEASDDGVDSYMGKLSEEGGIEAEPQSIETKEEPKVWPAEHESCEVQELSGYLYEYTPVSPYAGAEITIRDYEGEQLETDWDEPSAFRFLGEAEVTWRFYNSLSEMETGLNEAAMRVTDGESLHFLYYTFPMTKDDHALDLSLIHI